MKKYISLALILFLLCSQAFCKNNSNEEEAPWFAGTLFAYGGRSVPVGNFLIQPYFIVTRTYGNYDSKSRLSRNINAHLYQGVLVLQTGLVKHVDIQIVLSTIYARSNSRDGFFYTDTPVLLGFEIIEEDVKSWRPNIRVLLCETFPTGKFDNLLPDFAGADITGGGSFETTAIAVISKVFCTKSKHPFRANFNLIYSGFSKTKCDNFFFGGGGHDVCSVVEPGDFFAVNFAFEYKLSKYWALGTDLQYLHQNASRVFVKNTGLEHLLGSSDLLLSSFSLEYNFSAKVNAFTGIATTWKGRNMSAFCSWFITFAYMF